MERAEEKVEGMGETEVQEAEASEGEVALDPLEAEAVPLIEEPVEIEAQEQRPPDPEEEPVEEEEEGASPQALVSTTLREPKTVPVTRKKERNDCRLDWKSLLDRVPNE